MEEQPPGSKQNDQSCTYNFHINQQNLIKGTQLLKDSPLEHLSQFLYASLLSHEKTQSWPMCTCSLKPNNAGWFPCAAGTGQAGCRLVPTEWAH